MGGLILIPVMWVVIAASGPENHPFWMTPLGAAIQWAGAIALVIATLAGGVVGLRTLWKHYRLADAYMVERRRRDALLDQILSPEGWANGAKNIVDAHRNIYDKVAKVDERMAGIETSMAELQKAVEQVITN